MIEVIFLMLVGWPGITFIVFGGIGLLASWIFNKVPFIATYRLQVQVVSFILFSVGLFFQGINYNEDRWKLKLADARIEIAALEAKSAMLTNEVITEYVDRVVTVKEKGETIVKEIPKYIVKYDSRCELPNAFVELHDSAAKNKVPDPTRLANEGTSRVKLSTATETVVENYTTCHEIREQLKSLQKWVKEQERIHDVN